MTIPTAASGGRAMVNVFDGQRKLYSDAPQILITVRDGNQDIRSRESHRGPDVFFTGLPVYNNFGDNYTFIASADGYKDAGFFPVKLAANVDQIVDLMLIPQTNAFNFANATWQALGNSRPDLKTLLANGASSDEAEKRYGEIVEDQGGVELNPWSETQS